MAKVGHGDWSGLKWVVVWLKWVTTRSMFLGFCCEVGFLLASPMLLGFCGIFVPVGFQNSFVHVSKIFNHNEYKSPTDIWAC